MFPFLLRPFSGGNPDFGGYKSRGIRVLGGPCRWLIVYPGRVILEGSDPGGIMSAWDQDAKWEQGR